MVVGAMEDLVNHGWTKNGQASLYCHGCASQMTEVNWKCRSRCICRSTPTTPQRHGYYQLVSPIACNGRKGVRDFKAKINEWKIGDVGTVGIMSKLNRLKF